MYNYIQKIFTKIYVQLYTKNIYKNIYRYLQLYTENKYTFNLYAGFYLLLAKLDSTYLVSGYIVICNDLSANC